LKLGFRIFYNSKIDAELGFLTRISNESKNANDRTTLGESVLHNVMRYYALYVFYIKCVILKRIVIPPEMWGNKKVKVM
jgi:hypothetical protein